MLQLANRTNLAVIMDDAPTQTAFATISTTAVIEATKQDANTHQVLQSTRWPWKVSHLPIYH